MSLFTKFTRYLNVHNIFTGVSGEVGSFHQGSWTVFVRFAGCNLRCNYCDTAYTQSANSGQFMGLRTLHSLVIDESLGKDCKQVLLTGGEPLIQPADQMLKFIIRLFKSGYKIQIETNGTVDPLRFPYARMVTWVVDYKLPSAGLSSMMDDVSFARLPPGTWVKFVICGKDDYIVAKHKVHVFRKIRRNLGLDVLEDGLNMSFSAGPGWTHDKLFQSMKEDGIRDVTMNFQVHKLANLKE